MLGCLKCIGGFYMELDQERVGTDLRLFRIWLKASKMLFHNVIEDMKSYGLTSENFMVLELLYHKGPHYIQTISEKLMIPSGSITYVVNRLAEKNLVKKEQDKTNRRYWKVSITDKGEKLFHEIFPKYVNVIRDHFKSLTDDEKETLANLLKTVGFTAERLKEQKV